MWTTGRCLTIPMNEAGAAVGLWLFAGLLMIAETVTDADGRVARWAILVGIAAATLTIAAVVSHARRVVLDVISWEAQRTREAQVPNGSDRVVPMR